MAVSTLSAGNTVSVAPQVCLAPATAGELIQGATGQTDYLVNFPIDMFSTVRVSLSPAWRGTRVRQPGEYGKAVAAVNQLLAISGSRFGLELQFLSSVPRGKGLASSTSEIASALAAAAALLNFDLSEAASCLLNAGIEATDCVQATGISLVRQLSGQIMASWPAPAGISVIMVDCGGSVSTDDFDREKFRREALRNQDAHTMARHTLIRGLTRTGARDIGLAATISASINQKVLYKEQFPDLLNLARTEGALGVNCAHSGTIIGLLYEPAQVSEEELFAKIQHTFGREHVFQPHRLISGGVHAIVQ
jgi:L-threonine kinase